MDLAYGLVASYGQF